MEGLKGGETPTTSPVEEINAIVTAFDATARDLSPDDRRALADKTLENVATQFTPAQVDAWMVGDLGKAWLGGQA